MQDSGQPHAPIALYISILFVFLALQPIVVVFSQPGSEF
jgi:hypothetical protein